MSDPILPLQVWQSGTLQNSIPANDNALRLEALSRPCLGVANDESTPADGDVYLVGDTPTGAYATFDENDIAIYRSGNWYAWAPVDGLRIVVNDVRKVYIGGSSNIWDDDGSVSGGGGGGASTSQTEECISGLIVTPADGDYKIVVKAPHAGTITETTTICASGTCTLTFKINSTPLGGTANSVSTSEVSQAHASGNAFAAGDDIVITVSGNSSCSKMTFTIKYSRTLE